MGAAEILDIIDKSIKGLGLKKIVFSRPVQKNAGAQRADARLIMLKSGLHVQIARYMSDGKSLFVNVPADSAAQKLSEMLLEEFRQINVITASGECQAASKDGAVKIIFNRIKDGQAADGAAQIAAHDAEKAYLIEDAAFLRKLGIVSEGGKVFDKRRAKFRQINKFLELLKDAVDKLDSSGGLCVYDLCCGKGYLTFAAYHYLRNILGLDVTVYGADLKADVVDYCNKIARECGYDGLKFTCCDIADIKPDKKVDVVIALHACDVATDIALSHAVKWNARAILSAPCCQHELAAQLEKRPDNGDSLLKYNLTRYRFAQLLTDALRCSALEICGYTVQAVEFIDPDETDKNLMIRAVKRKTPHKPAALARMKEQLMAELARYGVSPSIAVMLQDRLK